MRRFLIALAVLTLAGCSRLAPEIDGRILCSLDGHAYQAHPGPGETTFLRPMPDADAVCKLPQGEKS